MKNIFKYGILSLVLLVSLFASGVKPVEAGGPSPCYIVYNEGCEQVLLDNHFAMFDLIFEYAVNDGYYDYASASHKYYLPNDTIYMSDNTSPEVTVKVTKSNCAYNPHTDDVRCYGDKKSKENPNFVDLSIIVNDQHNYLASYEAFKSIDNNLLYSRYPTRFTKLPSVVEKTFTKYYESREGSYWSLAKELDYDAMDAKGTFLKDTKSGLFKYTLKYFDDLKDVNDTYIKVKVSDTKGNISNVTISLGDLLAEYNEKIKEHSKLYPYMYDGYMCIIYGNPEYLCH